MHVQILLIARKLLMIVKLVAEITGGHAALLKILKPTRMMEQDNLLMPAVQEETQSQLETVQQEIVLLLNTIVIGKNGSKTNFTRKKFFTHRSILISA
jgi:hypothetical protein